MSMVVQLTTDLWCEQEVSRGGLLPADQSESESNVMQNNSRRLDTSSENVSSLIFLRHSGTFTRLAET